MAAASPPLVAKSLSVGQYVVPYKKEPLVAADGSFKDVHLTDLSRVGGGYHLFKWLWEPLGVTLPGWRRGLPYKLPLVQEIQAGISSRRAKRTRDGNWHDAEGNLLPTLLVLNVRGRDLQVLGGDPRKLMVNITHELDNEVESLELLDWFINQLWQDLHPPAAAGEQPAHVAGLAPVLDVDAPGYQLVDASGIAPGAASSDSGEFEARTEAALQKALACVRGHEATRPVSFDRKYHRFRVVLRSKVVKYHAVRRWKELVASADAELLEMALDTTTAELMESLEATQLALVD